MSLTFALLSRLSSPLEIPTLTHSHDHQHQSADRMDRDLQGSFNRSRKIVRADERLDSMPQAFQQMQCPGTWTLFRVDKDVGGSRSKIQGSNFACMQDVERRQMLQA